MMDTANEAVGSSVTVKTESGMTSFPHGPIRILLRWRDFAS